MAFLEFKEAQLFWFVFLFQEMIMFNLAKSDTLATTNLFIASIYILIKSFLGIYKDFLNYCVRNLNLQ